MIRVVPLTALFFVVGGCASVPPAAAPKDVIATSADTPPSHDNLNAVLWMQSAEEYRLVCETVYRAASAALDRALAIPDWDALSAEDRDSPAAGKPPAVIVDVDETVLDNTPYQAGLLRDVADHDEVRWKDWVDQARAQPAPGAVAFAQAAAARGVRVYFVTNRAEDMEAATLANLRQEGFPVEDEGQFLGADTYVENCEQFGSEKGCRRRLVGRSHRVLVQVGDQLGDLLTVLANTPQGRRDAIKAYRSWIGERWFMLPNPSYGSWEPALFNNDWSQPLPERRRLKRAALKFEN